MFASIVALLLIASLQVTLLQAFPSSITLPGIVRDFSCFHPDFESPVDWNSEQKGLFLPFLSRSPDERPISMPPTLRTPDSLTIIRSRKLNVAPTTTQYAISNFGQFFHDEYYTDVPGVNIAIPIEIQLNLIDEVNGIYNYKSSGFFPINDQGYVRELLDIIPLSQQATAVRTRNYWFTTEFRIRFYYRGGEIFNFNGDDDLWVFINGELTSCDLGSIHSARPCSIDLDEIGLLPNSTNEMVIFHAERHWLGSSFELTTSIVPINSAPVVNSLTITTNENMATTFQLPGFDPDYNSGLMFVLLSAPRHGSLSVPIGQWFPKETKLTYTPIEYFTGNDTFQFLMTDGLANSSVATARIYINPVETPPVAISRQYSVMVNSNLTFKLEATDVDTAQQDLVFYITSIPQHGYVRLDDKNGAWVMYEAVTVGTEVLNWQVSDGTFYVDGQTTIVVEPQPVVPPQAPLESGEVAGIVLGGIVFLAVMGVLVVTAIYHFIAAKRFERMWAEEFKNAQMMDNPLYKTARTERMNPLYIEKVHI